MNPCYRGYWAYGAKETKWLSDKDYARQVPRSEPLKSDQFEDLRIISDDVWYRAQQLLANEKGKSGRKPKDGDRKSRPRLLRGLFVCPEHGRQLVVGGPQGRILYCPLCRAIKAEKRPLFSHLNRALALELTCQTLASLVRADDALVADIIIACRREAEAVQKPDPEVPKRLRAQAKKLSSTIDFNRRNPGDTEEEQRQTERLLKELRHKQTNILAELAAHEAAQNGAMTIPEREEVLAMLDELAEILAAASAAETDEQMRAARRIIDELTGGRIELSQMGERKAQRGWLQGRFKVRLLSFMTERATGVRPRNDDDGVEVVIDFRKPPEIEALSERAKELYDQGMMNAQIANVLGRARCYVTKLLRFWFESRGLEMPDGRTRRATLKQKHLDPPLYQKIAEEVMVLYRQKKLLEDIAGQLECDRNTVTAAIRWWHEVRSLPVPDGRTRRKELNQKTRPKPHKSDAAPPTELPEEETKERSDQQ
jgi:hypothetical protein